MIIRVLCHLAEKNVAPVRGYPGTGNQHGCHACPEDRKRYFLLLDTDRQGAFFFGSLSGKTLRLNLALPAYRNSAKGWHLACAWSGWPLMRLSLMPEAEITNNRPCLMIVCFRSALTKPQGRDYSCIKLLFLIIQLGNLSLVYGIGSPFVYRKF